MIILMNFRFYKLLAYLLIPFFAGFFIQGAQAFDKENGKQLYNQYCSSCHGIDGRPLMPGTPDFSMREGLITSDNELYRVIADGKSIMPGYRGIINDDGIRDLIAFMRFNF